MVTNEKVKQYLYIPKELKNDDVMIDTFIEVAKVYLRNAVDNFDKLYVEGSDFEKQADLFITLYTAELYQNRNLYSSENRPSFIAKALMIQLQTYEGEE